MALQVKMVSNGRKDTFEDSDKNYLELLFKES